MNTLAPYAKHQKTTAFTKIAAPIFIARFVFWSLSYPTSFYRHKPRNQFMMLAEIVRMIVDFSLSLGKSESIDFSLAHLLQKTDNLFRRF